MLPILSVHSTGDPEFNPIADTVAVGEYRQLEIWDELLIGMAPYFDRSRLDHVAINYVYESTHPAYDEANFYTALIDNKVEVGEITDSGRYKIMPLKESQQPWHVDIIRSTMSEQTKTFDLAANEIAEQFAAYNMFRIGRDGPGYKLAAEDFHNFAEWYKIATGLEVEMAADSTLSIREYPEIDWGFDPSNSMFESESLSVSSDLANPLWGQWALYTILVDVLSNGTVECNNIRVHDAVPTLDETVLSNEVMEFRADLCERIDMFDRVAYDDNPSFSVESLETLKDWSRFSEWYNSFDTEVPKVEWELHFPIQEYVLVGVFPELERVRGTPVVSWNVETYDEDEQQLSGD